MNRLRGMTITLLLAGFLETSAFARSFIRDARRIPACDFNWQDCGSSGQPSFDIKAWHSRQTGVQQGPYYQQTELYSIEMEASAPLNALDKVPVQVKIRSASGELLHDFTASMRYRGSSSLGFPKKQYALSMADEKKRSLLGLAASEDYVLAAPYNDKTLVRDALAYSLGNSLGQYAPKTRFATGTMKTGEGDIQELGIMVLTEKIEISAGKIAIPKEKDGQTAFLLNFDRVKEDDRFVTTKNGLPLIIDFPKKKNLTAAHELQITSFLNDVEDRLRSPGSEGWTRLFDERLDLNSAVDFFIMQELGRNVDGYRLSSPAYLPPAGKMSFGPLWDFNLAFGNADYNNGARTDGFRAEEEGVWFQSMIDHPEFCQALKNRWQSLREGGSLSNATVFHTIDTFAELISPEVANNFAIWGGLGHYLWPNPYWLPTHELELDALKSWMALRADWMDKAIDERQCHLPSEIK